MNSYKIFTVLLFEFLRSLSAENSTDDRLHYPTCSRPRHFPHSIELIQETFQGFSNEIVAPDLWTAIPKNPSEVVDIANWAAEHGYKIRASGYMHSCSPITVTISTSCSTKILIVKTQYHLTDMELINHHLRPAIKTQTGASLEKFLSFAESNGYGILSHPSIGDVTIGGILAIGGHGTGVSVEGIQSPRGTSYGSLSNLVLSFTAVVWNPIFRKYVLRTFNRQEYEASAFLTAVGRTFLVDVTLAVGPAYKLRCESKIVKASELFASPHDHGHGKTFSSYLQRYGRVEAILYPFTEKLWLKTWTVIEHTPPSKSREVNQPYNYPFTLFGSPAIKMVDAISAGQTSLTPAFGQALLESLENGLIATDSSDIWGPSMYVLLDRQTPDTLPYQFPQSAYAIITSTHSVQKIISSVMTFYQDLIAEYKSRDEYPISGELNIRASGVDSTHNLGVAGAKPPSLSVVYPIDGNSELDTVLWFQFSSFSPGHSKFYVEFESFIHSKVHDNGRTAFVRPLWQDGWAYTVDDGPWTNKTFIEEVLPSRFSDRWASTNSILTRFDPIHVFSNDFLDKLFRDQDY